jgi:hypothetical protein
VLGSSHQKLRAEHSTITDMSANHADSLGGPAAAARARNAAGARAKHDWQGALDDARRISIPWYRAQALAHVVQHAPAEETDRIVALFDETVRGSKDEYQRVTLPFWLSLALLMRGERDRAERVAVGVVENSPRLVPIGSRAQTLELVSMALLAMRSKHLVTLAEKGALLAHPAAHWRCLRAARRVLGCLAMIDVDAARRVVTLITDQSTARRVALEIERIAQRPPLR